MDGLYGVAAVQGITKTEVLPFFQQAAVGGDLSLQQGLVFLGPALPLCTDLGQLRLQVQQDPIGLFH